METPPKWLSIGYLALFTVLPWSVDFDFGRWNLMVPAEPAIALAGIGLLVFCWGRSGGVLSLFRQNAFLQISLAYILWMAVSACFSTLPLVSWKYWIVAAGHWWVFAVGLSVWPDLWRRAIPYFLFSMSGVAVYTLVHHSLYQFRADQAILAPKPFFSDHTLWAAALALVLFLLGAWRWSESPKAMGAIQARKRGWVQMAQAGLLATALICSTGRAAWLSVLVAGVVWAFMVLGNKMRLALLLILLVPGFWAGPKITRYLREDVSSMERLNRWSCALRMQQDKPLFGFGPGTFPFQYLDYQRPEEMTRISVREVAPDNLPHPQGRGGGAHSEYFRALTELGWPGLLLWLGLAGIGLWAGFKRSKWISLALLTFFAHGLVNDFMQDGRIAALVWGALALVFSAKKSSIPGSVNNSNNFSH